MASQAFVEVVADVSQVDGQIETGFDRAIRDVERQLPGVEVGAEVDPRSIDRLSRSLASDLRGIESSLEGVDVRTLVSEESVRAVQNRISTLDQQLQAIDVDVNPEVNAVEVERARASLRNLQATLPDITAEVDVEVDEDSVRGVGRDIESRIAPDVQAAGTRAGGLFADGLSGALRTPAVGAVIAAAAAAAFLTVAPAVAALGVGGLVAAAAFNGFGDAVAAIIEGDQEKIDEALGGLSVSARNVANDLITAMEPLRQFGTVLQEQFFQPLTETIPRLTQAFSGLREPILQVATVMGELVDQVLRSLSDEGSIKDFNTILENTAVIIPVLAPLIGGVLSGAITVLAQVMDTGVKTALLFRDAFNQVSVGIQTFITQTVVQFERLRTIVSTAVSATSLAVRTAFNAIRSTVLTVTSAIGTFIRNTWNSLRNSTIAVFNAIRATVSSNVNAILSTVSSVFSSIFSTVSGAVSDVQSSISSGFNAARSAAASAINRLADAVRAGIGDAVAFVRDLPSRARSALGGLGGVLYSAGRSLIGGFIDGIRSAIGEVRDAAASVVGAARDFFPFSPAKEGPLSGRGYTTFAGQAMIEGFIQGMESRQAQLAAASGRVLSVAAAGGSTAGARGAVTTSTASGMAEGIGFASGQRTTPSLTVILGNRFITDYVEGIVTDQQAARDRMLSRGIRR